MSSPTPAAARAVQSTFVAAQEHETTCPRDDFSTTTAAGNPFACPRSDATAEPRAASPGTYNAAPRNYGAGAHEASPEEKTVDLTGDDNFM
jgi:hypothetical protein